MKIRTGFVSNSSSSSFVVLFPCVPKNADDVHNILFGEEEKMIQPYDDALSSRTVASLVYEDILKQPENLEETLKDLFESLSYNEQGYDYKDDPRERKEDYDRREKIALAAGSRGAKAELEKQTGEKKLYVFEYADEDGVVGSVMEHGGIFDALPHTRISHH